MKIKQPEDGQKNTSVTNAEYTMKMQSCIGKSALSEVFRECCYMPGGGAANCSGMLPPGQML